MIHVSDLCWETYLSLQVLCSLFFTVKLRFLQVRRIATIGDPLDFIYYHHCHCTEKHIVHSAIWKWFLQKYICLDIQVLWSSSIMFLQFRIDTIAWKLCNNQSGGLDAHFGNIMIPPNAHCKLCFVNFESMSCLISE